MPPVSQREIAFDVWRSLLHKPYIWGGDDPVVGVDCSGTVILGLQAAGILPRKGDWNAATLATIWAPIPLSHPPEVGNLLFWNRGIPPSIGHVEIVWAVLNTTKGVKIITLGASGGGSGTKTAEDAAKQNAFVKMHEVEPGWARMVDPFS